MEGLHFRNTTADDYNVVVSLRENVYDGLDYIPSRYHQYLDIFTGLGGYIGTEMNISIFKTTLTAIKPLVKTKHISPSLQTVDQAYLQHVFSCPRASASLFPENKIIVSCLPYKPIPSNIERIVKSVSEMLASGTKDSICPHELSMKSAATEDDCVAGRVLFLDIFGDISNEKNLSDHIYKQTGKFLTSCKGEDLVL
ncbi:uncharacterized protein LOC110464647 [Mizuhopecten yessoensis]|uniref:uncharacterized protein LOC110464647 n=1 Tax=Mizuhopecten yessoensis TaxID=6573 RepID=UPI000B45ACFA|nr:uncharacterized protein LOC110464647 [Mizuhopecten yessoensis]